MSVYNKIKGKHTRKRGNRNRLTRKKGGAPAAAAALAYSAGVYLVNVSAIIATSTAMKYILTWGVGGVVSYSILKVYVASKIADLEGLYEKTFLIETSGGLPVYDGGRLIFKPGGLPLLEAYSIIEGKQRVWETELGNFNERFNAVLSVFDKILGLYFTGLAAEENITRLSSELSAAAAAAAGGSSANNELAKSRMLKARSDAERQSLHVLSLTFIQGVLMGENMTFAKELIHFKEQIEKRKIELSERIAKQSRKIAESNAAIKAEIIKRAGEIKADEERKAQEARNAALSEEARRIEVARAVAAARAAAPIPFDEGIVGTLLDLIIDPTASIESIMQDYDVSEADAKEALRRKKGLPEEATASPAPSPAAASLLPLNISSKNLSENIYTINSLPKDEWEYNTQNRIFYNKVLHVGQSPPLTHATVEALKNWIKVDIDDTTVTFVNHILGQKTSQGYKEEAVPKKASDMIDFLATVPKKPLPLPEGWTSEEDENGEVIRYTHKPTGETSSERPTSEIPSGWTKTPGWIPGRYKWSRIINNNYNQENNDPFPHIGGAPASNTKIEKAKKRLLARKKQIEAAVKAENYTKLVEKGKLEYIKTEEGKRLESEAAELDLRSHIDNKSFEISNYIRLLSLSYQSFLVTTGLKQDVYITQIITNILKILDDIIPLYTKKKMSLEALYPNMPNLKEIDEKNKFFSKMIEYNVFLINNNDEVSFINIIVKFRRTLGIDAIIEQLKMPGMSSSNVGRSDQKLWLNHVEKKWVELTGLIELINKLIKARAALEERAASFALDPFDYHIRLQKGGSSKKSSNSSSGTELFKLYKDGYSADMALVKDVPRISNETIDGILRAEDYTDNLLSKNVCEKKNCNSP